VCAEEVKETGQKGGNDNSRRNRPYEDDLALAPQISTSHSWQKVKSLFFFISCEPGHTARSGSICVFCSDPVKPKPVFDRFGVILRLSEVLSPEHEVFGRALGGGSEKIGSGLRSAFGVAA
jgi:hypothetical protein